MLDVIYGVATSLDGFIAPPDGSSDWLTRFMQSSEDYGLMQLMESMGAILRGSRTYEQAIAQFGSTGSKTPCHVFSSRQLPAAGPHVTITDKSPREVVAELKERGIVRAWLMGGVRLSRRSGQPIS